MVTNEKKNSMITAVEKIVGYEFINKDLLWEALQAAGNGVFVIGDRHIGTTGNKSLALLGDKVLAMSIAQDSYVSGQTPESTTNSIARIVNNANLDRVGRENNLHKYINTNPAQWGSVSPKTMANTVEAIIGAAFRDGGLAAVNLVTVAIGLE